jgi:hypothetical protein
VRQRGGRHAAGGNEYMLRACAHTWSSTRPPTVWSAEVFVARIGRSWDQGHSARVTGFRSGRTHLIVMVSEVGGEERHVTGSAVRSVAPIAPHPVGARQIGRRVAEIDQQEVQIGFAGDLREQKGEGREEYNRKSYVRREIERRRVEGCRQRVCVRARTWSLCANIASSLHRSPTA